MTKQSYEVPILYRGRSNFIVEADSPLEAQEKAVLLFNTRSLASIHSGYEFEKIVTVREAVPVVD